MLISSGELLRTSPRMTPQTVTEPIFPVTLGPPKFATVVSQRRPMTPMVVATAVEDSQGKKEAR